jgi:hypothetical protein
MKNKLIASSSAAGAGWCDFGFTNYLVYDLCTHKGKSIYQKQTMELFF